VDKEACVYRCLLLFLFLRTTGGLLCRAFEANVLNIIGNNIFGSKKIVAENIKDLLQIYYVLPEDCC